MAKGCQRCQHFGRSATWLFGCRVMRNELPSGLRRIAIVTHGFGLGGGVPGVVRWLREGLKSLGGYSVDVHDLATSSRDRSSRRLVAPGSWLRSTLQSTAVVDQQSLRHWGANAVELEVMRYRPRRELTRALLDYD